MSRKLKRLAILGSTGSIGQQTLEVARAFPDRFQIIGLAAGQNLERLARQVEEFKPALIYHQGRRTRPTKTERELVPPEDMVRHPEVDTVVIATSGKAGLAPTLAAVKAGKNVALANKESLVAAGEIIIREAKANGARIVPIDSEHSAIWQCLQGEKTAKGGPARIILTASGGPFRHYTKTQLSRVTPAQALKHPSWQMGKKVTIDSATLMNKGLEVIEAHWLFDLPVDRVTVIIHPQSIIHSMVELADGVVKAQLSYPDMRLPIQYALAYPERLPNPALPRLDWNQTKELTFEPPDFNTFPCLKLAIEAGKQGGTYPAVLCAADEVAVELFLAQRIKFTDIAQLVELALNRHKSIPHPSLEEIMAADEWARERVMQSIAGENPWK
jgi:1-deoxy-D-xylulose-5-phosphate reductoisomerase